MYIGLSVTTLVTNIARLFLGQKSKNKVTKRAWAQRRMDGDCKFPFKCRYVIFRIRWLIVSAYMHFPHP